MTRHRPPRSFSWTLGVVTGLLALVPTASGQFTSRLSVDDFGGEANASSIDADVSANGRHVAFASDASNLVPGDTNGVTDCFVYDTLNRTIERVSVGLFGVQGDQDSRIPVISNDGRWVVFESDASTLVPNDTNGVQDSFLYDRELDVITRVSVSWTGQQANNTSSIPKISGDGNHVVFGAWASNLVLNDNNGTQDIFVRDLQQGTTIRLSRSSGGVEANDYCKDPSISDDGRYVVYESEASNLVPGDVNGERDIFLHDRLLGQTTRISVSTQGVEANDDSYDAIISGDGRWIVFESDASNLVAIDTNGVADVFLYDRVASTTVRVTRSYNGVPTDGGAGDASVSADGSVVAFRSGASNLVPGDANGVQDVFRWEQATGSITRVSMGHDGGEVDDDCNHPRISADGRQIVFNSESSKLVLNDLNGDHDVFEVGPLLTLEAGTTILAEGDTLDLNLWQGTPGSPMMHVLVAVDAVPFFLPVHFGFFAADWTYRNSVTVPTGAAGHTFDLMSFACCGAAGGPGLFASNVVSLTVQ